MKLFDDKMLLVYVWEHYRDLNVAWTGQGAEKPKICMVVMIWRNYYTQLLVKMKLKTILHSASNLQYFR